MVQFISFSHYIYLSRFNVLSLHYMLHPIMEIIRLKIGRNIHFPKPHSYLYYPFCLFLGKRHPNKRNDSIYFKFNLSTFSLELFKSIWGQMLLFLKVFPSFWNGKELCQLKFKSINYQGDRISPGNRSFSI